MSAHQLPIDIDRALRNKFFRAEDPGAGETISFHNKGLAICEVTTAAAESRVLPSAAGYGLGQRLLVVLYEDGGDLTIETADTPDTILTAAGQVAEFVVTRKEVGGTVTHEWRRLSLLGDGAALTAADGSTVDNTYGQEENDVITNLVVRVGEIEDRLQAAGIIA